MKRVLAVCALVCLIAQADWAASQVRIPNALSEPEERNLIETWKSQKAADGATFLDVLKFAQSMRPKQFKYGDIEVNYGSAPGIGVQYYNGAKRLDGDAFNLFFETKVDGSKYVITTKMAPELGRELEFSLARGRDAFLREVDAEYQLLCVVPATKKLLC
jgi:hypothetical protein